MCQPSPSPIPRMQVTLETNPIYRLLDLLFKHLVPELNKYNLHFSVISEHQIPTDINAKLLRLEKNASRNDTGVHFPQQISGCIGETLGAVFGQRVRLGAASVPACIFLSSCE